MFRYSAITFNSHRIHYDLNYARAQEGYSNLLVHGPLLAKFALDELSILVKNNLKSFEFKMLKPVLVNEKVNLKIFQNKENNNIFKIVIIGYKCKELKFIALCAS